jgi:hypothetical protein
VSLSQLLAKLLDNVNLGKMLVDGGPGMLLAVALLLLACAGLKQDNSVSNSTPFLKLVVAKEIERLKGDLKTAEGENAAFSGAAARDDQELQNLSKKIARAEALSEEARTHVTRAGEAGQREARLDELYTQAAQVRTRKASDEKSAEFAAKHVEDARAKLEQRRQELIRDGRGLLSELISLTLGLSIFGYILGTLFSGLNRNLWLLRIPSLFHQSVGRLYSSFLLRRRTSPTEKAQVILQHQMQLAELERGSPLVLEEHVKDRFLARLQLKFGQQGISIGEASSVNQGSRQTSTLTDVGVADTDLKAYPSVYYIGRGIISQQEYDGFVTSYYRWAEGIANLIIPVFILCVALHFNGQRWLPSPMLAALVFIIVLYFAAQNCYGEFKRRVRDFIKGRLDQEAQKRKDTEKASPPSAGGVVPRPVRQRLEIIADGDKAAELLKLMEQILYGRTS